MNINPLTNEPKKRQSLPVLPSPLERLFDGPMTQEMLLEPAKFGLGLVPQKSQPDATTNMVCGFCSTGCALNVHMKDGEAINLSPWRKVDRLSVFPVSYTHLTLPTIYSV